CTRLLARCTWPGRPGYGLKPLGDWLGVEFRHHDALEDTRCCVQIALAVQQRQELQELAALEQQLRITRGAYRQGQIVSPRRIGGRDGGAGSRGPSQADRWGFPDRRARNLGAADPEAIVRAAAGRQPLAGKRIVLLGPLRGLSLEHSRELIDRLGGHSQESVAADTDYVVACGTTLDAAGQIVCAALAAADSNPESPASHAEGIRLLSERQFRALLPAGKTSLGW
ncbi:MAG: hypothetical protein KDA45_10790, partial [Planctomycetales bacterium]|nr:hypothetical protein [Planctomycetales bacterium]